VLLCHHGNCRHCNNTLQQHTATTHCNNTRKHTSREHTATHCNTSQEHTVTRCNTYRMHAMQSKWEYTLPWLFSMIYVYACHDSFIYGMTYFFTWRVWRICKITNSCVTWRIHVWHDSFIGDATRCVWHVVFLGVCEMLYSCVRNVKMHTSAWRNAFIGNVARVLQCAAMRCSVFKFDAACCSVLECVGVCCSALPDENTHEYE